MLDILEFFKLSNNILLTDASLWQVSQQAAEATDSVGSDFVIVIGGTYGYLKQLEQQHVGEVLQEHLISIMSARNQQGSPSSNCAWSHN